MKKLLLISALAALSVSNAAFADEIRVVVKKKIESHASSNVQKMNTQEAKFSTMTVGSEAEIDALKASGEYESVEIDHMIYTPEQSPTSKSSKNGTPALISAPLTTSATSTGNSIPNDPDFIYQSYWTATRIDTGADIFEDHPGRNNILAAYQKAKPKVKPRVGVIDTSFGLNDDLTYTQGYAFSTIYGRQRKADFITQDDVIDLTGGGHGISVAAIIGAATNNNIQMAGIADVEIIAAESMFGGVGYISDAADAITWVAGGSISGVPAIGKQVDIINMSFGSKITSGCPSFLQEAINFATSKGIVVVASAGNDAENASLYSPANCKNVITVGAIQDDGKRAEFSNFGTAVDVMALGQGVLANGSKNRQTFWDGTSQAAPIVAGIVAMAKSEFPGMVHEEAEMLLKVTAVSQPDPSCANGACGAGVVDASEFLDMARDYMNSPTNYIKHVLNDGDNCGSAVFKDYFGESLRLCEMYEITFDLNAEAKSNITYQLYSVPAGKTFYLTNAIKVMETNEPSIVTGNPTIDAKAQYGYLECTNGQCGTQLMRLGTENIAKPSICN